MPIESFALIAIDVARAPLRRGPFVALIVRPSVEAPRLAKFLLRYRTHGSM